MPPKRNRFGPGQRIRGSETGLRRGDNARSSRSAGGVPVQPSLLPRYPAKRGEVLLKYGAKSK